MAGKKVPIIGETEKHSPMVIRLFTSNFGRFFMGKNYLKQVMDVNVLLAA